MIYLYGKVYFVNLPQTAAVVPWCGYGGNIMPYPIITPAFYADLSDKTNPENEGVVYNVLVTPSSIEYVFPLNQDRVIKTLMNTPDMLQYKMTSLKPEHEAEYEKKGQEMIKQNPVLQNYWILKTLTMNILQNRNYVFEKRMLLLNFAYKTVQGMMDKSKGHLIPAFVGEFLKTPEHDEVIKYFESVKPNFAYSLCDGLSFLRTMPSNEALDKVRFTVFKNVGCDQSMRDFKFDESKYIPMKKAYYEDFLKGREHYIEHIMVNYVWTYCMPYADFSIPLWDNFVFFNTLFNTIKVMLTCYTFDREDKDEAFLTAIKAFDTSLREIKGNVVKRIVDANVKEGLATNGDMAILAMS